MTKLYNRVEWFEGVLIAKEIQNTAGYYGVLEIDYERKGMQLLVLRTIFAQLKCYLGIFAC